MPLRHLYSQSTRSFARHLLGRQAEQKEVLRADQIVDLDVCAIEGADREIGLLDVEADGTAQLEWVTDALVRITGYTQEELRTLAQWDAVIHPEDGSIAEQHHQRLSAGQPHVAEYRIVAKDGRVLWLRLYNRPVWDAALGRVVRIYGAAQDITRIKHLERQLNQAQKMEAIGRLAGGIAHDFNIYLPQVDTAAEVTGTAQAPAQLHNGSGTILLVEDESLVRELAARVLRAQGYQVLEASDSQMALQLCAAYADTIDVLLTDVIMPGGMNGRELAEQ